MIKPMAQVSEKKDNFLQAKVNIYINQLIDKHKVGKWRRFYVRCWIQCSRHKCLRVYG